MAVLRGTTIAGDLSVAGNTYLGASLLPITSDGMAIGSATRMVSDVFIASGGVINFNNGDVTLTHGSNVLTLAGGDLAVGANNITITGSIGATGARVTKGWFTNLEVTNTITGNAATATTLASIATTFSGTYPMVVNVSGTLYSHTNITYNGTSGVLSITGLSLNSTAITSTGTQLNYLSAATGTTGTTSTNVVFSTSPALTTPTIVTSIVGGATFAAFNTTTTTLSFGGAATSMTIGNSAAALTHNYSTGATTNGVTKAINIGTEGLSGSITTINIGSAVSGATGSLYINSRTIYIPYVGSVINWAAGDLTLTQAANRLTLAGGDLYVPALYTTSSREHKENIKEAKENALDIISKVKIVDFNFKKDASKKDRIGFIAEDTNTLLTGIENKNLDVSNTIGLLLKAAQELMKRIENLEYGL